MKILIVEDDTDIARALAARLGRVGHAVAVAPDAISAMSRAREHGPDVVLLDLGLPGGGGLVVADRLMQAPETAATRIVVITGNADPAVRRSLAERGLPVLGKPFSLGDLLDAITA